MASTYELIASYTASSSVSSIDFTSIPATYTDLIIKTSLRSDYASSNDWVKVSFNSVTTNLSQRNLYGSGSAAASSSDTAIYAGIDGASATSSTFGNTEIYIPNYAISQYKSLSMDSVSENNATAARADLVAGLWSSTSAISAIKLAPYVGTVFLQYSTAYLYGVKNA